MPLNNMTPKETAGLGQAQPAQSDAPSAEQWRKERFKDGIIHLSLTTIDEVLEAYAALRTAQLEKEIREELAKYTNMHDAETVIGGIRNLAQAFLSADGNLKDAEAKVAQLEQERDAEKVVMTAYMKGILKALGLPENEPVNLIWAAQEVVKRAETTESSLAKALDEAKSWKRSFEQYRNAWIRELGGWLVPKSHEIDSLVLTMRKRVVNPLLGNCSVPHWLGKPTSDGKALQQTPHPHNNDCRDWKADDSEPNPRAEAAESALSEARERTIQECIAICEDEKAEYEASADALTQTGHHVGAEHDICGGVASKASAKRLRALLTSSASAKGE